MFLCSLYVNTVQSLNQFIDFAWHFYFYRNLSLKLLSFVLLNLTPFPNMFVNFLNTSMLLSRGDSGGTMRAHLPPGSVKYMLFFLGGGVCLPPPKKRKKCKPFLGKNLNTPLLISLTSLYRLFIDIFQDEKCRLMRNLSLSMELNG